jgi:DNA-binding FadR family transcriptional regulator
MLPMEPVLHVGFCATRIMTMQQYEIALKHLRSAIAAGAIAESGRLMPERELAAHLGISRRAVRRALEVLEAEGVLTRRQGHGTFVAGNGAPLAADPLPQLLALNNPIDIIEVRLTLEPALARLAAMRASQCDIDRLVRMAEDTGSAGSPKEYARADAAFHRRIALAARNPVFLALFEAIMAVVEQATWRQGRETGHCINNQAIYAQCHRDIAQAIAARNGDMAQERMRSHLSRVQQQLLAMLYPMSEVS